MNQLESVKGPNACLATGSTPEQIATTLVRIASASVGFRYDEDRFWNLCFPGRGWQRTIRHLDARICCSYLRLAGVDHPLLTESPHCSLEAVAFDLDAYGGPDRAPGRGDILVLGADLPDGKLRSKMRAMWGGPKEFVFVEKVRTALNGVPIQINTIEPGREGIVRKIRSARRQRNGWLWVRDWTDKRVAGVVLCRQLRFHNNWSLPGA